MTRIAPLLLLAALVGGLAASGQARRTAQASCPPQQVDAAYAARVNAALAAKQDVWGNELLHAAGGPSYRRAQSYLHPLMLVGPPSGDSPNRLTDSGIYYLAFGRPRARGGWRSINLHVADGSQIVSQYAKRARLSVDVGPAGYERYGSCLARLALPTLAAGYLPILRTRYIDASGVRYRQESFATRIPQTRSLVSFVRVTVGRGGSVRFLPSVSGLRRVGNQLRGPAHKAFLVFGADGKVDTGSVLYRARKKPLTVYAAWLARPALTREFLLDRSFYLSARRSAAAYWNRRLAAGAQLQVPDRRVMNAERNLLIQNLLHTWRYSLGNSYERFSWEMVDVAEVLGEYGFTAVEREIVTESFRRRSVFPNRAWGVRMAGVADYYRRTGDKRFVDQMTPALTSALLRFQLQLARSPNGLLDRERYGVDVTTLVYGLHGQTLALQGLRAMAPVWQKTGYGSLAGEATQLATQLEAGLRAAIAASSARLPDGSLFIPIPLLDGVRPYDVVTGSYDGSYWNLVMPYALASGLFPPGSREANGVLRYMLGHGSRLLGLVRFRAYPNVGKAGYRAPGVDDVYGTSTARFLADNDQADLLVLSLYGKLAADMTPNTFVSGEGSTVGPVDGEYYRSMFRPPNAANNAFFLETLRLMLVHETRGADGAPDGLELAFATPRRWLLPGKRIAVRGMRTSFGALSFSLAAGQRSVRARVTVPRRLAPGTLKLRLRLPVGKRITGVSVDGRKFDRFDPGTGTIDLSGLTGRVSLVASYS